jgi:hypothetical protein
VIPINRIAHLLNGRMNPTPDHQDEPMPTTKTAREPRPTTPAPSVAITEYSAFCKPAIEILRPPAPMARLTSSFCVPGSTEMATIETIVFGSDNLLDLEASDPVGTYRDVPELAQAGWHHHSAGEMNIFTRVVVHF